MKKDHSLYYLTAAATLMFVLYLGASLLQAMAPADVPWSSSDKHTLIRLDTFEPGDARVLKSDELILIVWRRNAEDIARALQQDDPDLWPTPLSIKTGHEQPVPATDANLTVNHEWFIAEARHPGRIACVVLPRAGDFGGFYDPCREAHYDLAGRARKGPSLENLVVLGVQLTEDGEHFWVSNKYLPEVLR